MNFEIAPKSTEFKATWDDAYLRCFCLNIDGKVGWRLPTKDELYRIYLSENDFDEALYWSSTDYDLGDAWYQNFGTVDRSHSGQHGGNKNYDGIYARAIRDL